MQISVCLSCRRERKCIWLCISVILTLSLSRPHFPIRDNIYFERRETYLLAMFGNFLYSWFRCCSIYSVAVRLLIKPISNACACPCDTLYQSVHSILSSNAYTPFCCNMGLLDSCKRVLLLLVFPIRLALHRHRWVCFNIFFFHSFLLLFIRVRDSVFAAATTTTTTLRQWQRWWRSFRSFFLSLPCFQHTIAFLSRTEQWRQPNYKGHSFERR